MPSPTPSVLPSASLENSGSKDGPDYLGALGISPRGGSGAGAMRESDVSGYSAYSAGSGRSREQRVPHYLEEGSPRPVPRGVASAAASAGAGAGAGSQSGPPEMRLSTALSSIDAVDSEIIGQVTLWKQFRLLAF